MIRRPPRSPLFPSPPLSRSAVVALSLAVVPPLRANPPVASYVFPAGGQRGTTVPVRVGGLFLRSEEHTSELQSQSNLVCRLLLEKKKKSSTMLHKAHTPALS